ncbi:plasmid replication initiator protein RepA [Jannaschia sp. AI_61]|uniref:plasmid replication initiator TrfA n=1 Tax=Jannaschia sp. AI_61 TaxID=2829796 RepID=UPI001BC3CD71|nr:replication initiator protein A [Jannaschia sp. AI_61]GIT93297.1 plasmid replication initiator protein RepA [Jannaschia sp. AI_61]
MVGEISNSMADLGRDPGRSPLLPDRHPTPDFFVCDVFDAVPKGDLASMEHPIFSLSTKPDTRLRRYEQGDIFVEVTPSVKGLATVHDRDILIYCISQIVGALNEGRAVDRTIRLKAHDLLTSTNRMTNGQAYEGLKAALERLRGTTISTNIKTGGTEALDVFGLIERARIVRETRDGRMQDVEIVLSDWVFNAIEAREVLTLHRDYFRLRKPLERRMYELARKHCGHQAEWSIGLERLREKCGSTSTLKEFRRLVRTVVEQDRTHSHIPDYAVDLVERVGAVEKVVFLNRQTMERAPLVDTPPPLSHETHDAARQIAPGWDVHAIEQDWRSWCLDKACQPKDPARHFLKFCMTWVERRGLL